MADMSSPSLSTGNHGVNLVTNSGPASGVVQPRIATASATTTITTTAPQNQTDEVLRLTLRSRPNVTWDQNVLDNEGMGRKSSKRCCIFHKDRPFGESSTDSSEDDESSHHHDSNGKRIAHKKKSAPDGTKPKKTPDHLRFHA